jgi:hypothetical protein
VLFPLCTVSNIAVLGPFSSMAVCAVLYTSIVIAVRERERTRGTALSHMITAFTSSPVPVVLARNIPLGQGRLS